MILAPRHPERFEAVAALLEASGLPWIRRSAWKTQPSENLKPPRGIQVVLLDTIGELASVYSVASVALGRRQPGSGRRTQPARAGTIRRSYRHGSPLRQFPRRSPTIFWPTGPSASPPKEELTQALVDLLTNSDEARAMGERARQVFEQQAGATGRCVEAIRGLLGYRPEAPALGRAASEHRA